MRLSKRVRRIVDSPAMQRLRDISQLGLVSKVYPGATHSRFEHSLGVYRLACEVLQHLCLVDAGFKQGLIVEDAETFLLAALLHDVGHWPYCHPIEDLQLGWVPAHESLARELICEGAIEQSILEDWCVKPERVAGFLEKADLATEASRILQNVLDGPVDIDKMDYLQRDSLHAGVPYGRNFDVRRLVSSLCVNEDSSGVAITGKGKTAAEMMVFARYIMFSEVYWHHTVRSATAMLQRLVSCLSGRVRAQDWLELGDAGFGQQCLQLSNGTNAEYLAAALFGTERQLYKRLLQFAYHENPEVHQLLAGRPYAELKEISDRLAIELERKLGLSISEHDLLIDAPPVKLEVQFQMPVRVSEGRSGEKAEFVGLSDVSPVVNTLATQQFDSYVKQVRVFCRPAIRKAIQISEAELILLLEHSAK